METDMSTTAAPRRAFDHHESQRRVSHPLQTLRKYIRAYVLLEGLAIALLFLAAWYWLGLLIDYGSFRLFAFDWLQELRDLGSDAADPRQVLGVLGFGFSVLFGIVAMVWIARRTRTSPVLVFIGTLWLVAGVVGAPLSILTGLGLALTAAVLPDAFVAAFVVILALHIVVALAIAFPITRVVLRAIQNAQRPGLSLLVRILACLGWAGLILTAMIVALAVMVALLAGLLPMARLPSGLIVRFIVLGVVLAVLAGVVITKVALRWMREFNDRSLALVLERRFPNELGDRLITAVELANPKLAAHYGYSQAMVEETIRGAVDRIDRLPVAGVFNWGRLVWWWVFVALATVGMLLLVAVSATIIGMATGTLSSPMEFSWRFADVSAIWTERNVLMQDTYWPRRAHLEYARFQGKHQSPNEMRVPRDEARPDLLVRAVEWVIADPTAPDGWRALRWQDLADRGLIDGPTLARVNIPEDWPSWVIDLDDLDAAVPGGMVPANLQGRTAGEVRQALNADPKLQNDIAQASPTDAVDQLLNWKRWTVDKIGLQMAKDPVRLRLRTIDAQTPLEEVFAKLEAAAELPSMSRTLRKLEVPADKEVKVIARGDTSIVSEPCEMQTDRKFAFALRKLKETSRVRLQAADYYTPVKLITLVAPPSVRRLSVDKAEPAYLYHRLQGGEQGPLLGKKQIFNDYTVSITGELSTIDVPIGTDLVVRAQTDRKLRRPVRIKPPATRDAGALVPELESVLVGDDEQSFTVAFQDVKRTYDFLFEFHDEDNVRGQRHVRIRPVDDLPPSFEGDVGLSVVLRKPHARGTDPKSVQGTAADGFLITPDALLPFVGQIRDDHGLTRVGWQFEAEPVDIELIGPAKGSKEKLPTLVLGGNARIRRAGLIATTFQYNSANFAPRLAIPSYLTLFERILTADLNRSGVIQNETFVMMNQFANLLEAKGVGEIPAIALNEKLLQAARPLPGWEFNLRDEAGFDVRKLLPKLKGDARTEGQLHYLLKVSVLATDNNVESGKAFQDENGRTFWGKTTRSKTPLQFLIVTENELLSQIALEEETLHEKLEKAYDKLKLARVLTEEQEGKLADASLKNDDIATVSLRLDESRKAIADAASDTGQVFRDYDRILKEMEANRVQKDRLGRIEDLIVRPLEKMTSTANPEPGSFVLVDELFKKAYEAVDEDVQGKRGLANRTAHQQNLQKAGKDLDVLMQRLNSVLIALSVGQTESKAREMVLVMEQNQRRIRDDLRILENDAIRKLLEEATKGN
jgi:hypothetical protein